MCVQTCSLPFVPSQWMECPPSYQKPVPSPVPWAHLLTFRRTSLLQLPFSLPASLLSPLPTSPWLPHMLHSAVLKTPWVTFASPLAATCLCSLSQMSRQNHWIHVDASQFLFYLHLSEFCLQHSTEGALIKATQRFPIATFNGRFFVFILLTLLAAFDEIEPLKYVLLLSSLTPHSQ